jgi:hypothetical protein
MGLRDDLTALYGSARRALSELVYSRAERATTVTASTSNFGDRFYVYETVTGSVRVSAYALRGLTARTVVRTGQRVMAPDGDQSPAAFGRWLGELRAAGIAVESLPAVGDDTGHA